MNDAVLQSHLPDAPWLDPALWRLPGTKPLDPALWLMQDDAFDGQMAVRDRLIAEREKDVHAMLPKARDAAEECLDLVLDHCAGVQGYSIDHDQVTRPDGIVVPLARAHPLLTLGRLVQEDVCILQKGEGGEHILTGALLCFPASWSLAEKVGKPLTRIHDPVAQYSEDVALRVQRMFDRLRPETPMWRANALLYENPELFQPKREGDATRHISGVGRYLRSERQTMRRLPQSGAILFAIHTFVVPIDALTRTQRDNLGQVVDRHYKESEHSG